MPIEDTLLPMAETFYSIQGEGRYTGFPMYFVRLAGCNVGRYHSPFGQVPIKREGQIEPPEWEPGPDQTPFQVLHPEHSTCTSFTGEKFICDTDYRVKEKVGIGELARRIYESGAKHVSFTGGEPLIHKAFPSWTEYIQRTVKRVIKIHVETSGTLPIPALIGQNAWITCSPKEGFLTENVAMIDQVKFLVKDELDIFKVEQFIAEHKMWLQQIYLQPIQSFLDSETDRVARDACVRGCLANPAWAVSLQVHKVLGVR